MYVTPAQEPINAHKLLNDPFTISSSVVWTHLYPETRFAASRILERKEFHDWCLEQQKYEQNINPVSSDPSKSSEPTPTSTKIVQIVYFSTQ